MEKLKVREKDLQKSIIDYLRLQGHFVWKSHTTGIYDATKNCLRKVGLQGIADIIGISRDGRFIAIEVKVKPNKATEKQIEFINEIKRRKGIAGIVYNLQDVIDLF